MNHSDSTLCDLFRQLSICQSDPSYIDIIPWGTYYYNLVQHEPTPTDIDKMQFLMDMCLNVNTDAKMI